MSDELVQNASQSQSSKASIFLKMFSFLIPLLDVIKLIIASVTSVILIAFACLTLGGSAVALIVSTPLFIIFSPILVPATIATTLLATGLTAGTTLGVTGIGLIMGLIRTAEGFSLARRLGGRSQMLKKGLSKYRGKMGGGGMPGGGMPGGGGGSRQQFIKKLIEFLKKQRGGGGMAGGGSREEFIKKLIEFLKKQRGGMGGGMAAGGAEPPAAGAEPPAAGAEPGGDAKPPGGDTPTE